ncbi:MAG TPA: hypothetical protein VK815_01215 [Candidatus Acidoferrales bacterium]|jgi:hypothetical protein|nr:hypothetical protein [Candidatus Acidoferrales bacterium]
MDTPPPAQPFAHQAAKLSWVCPLILIVINIFAKQVASPLIIDLLALVLIAVGFIFGIIALFGIPKHGTKGILGAALASLVINGLLISIFVTNFMAARAKARQQSGTGTSPVMYVARSNK